MAVRNTKLNYGSVAKSFHWLMFFLILAMLILGYFLSSIPKDYAGLAYNTHKVTGLLILLLIITRALWSLSNVKPVLPNETLPWQRLAEHVIQFFLYIALIAMPLSAWIGSSAANKAPHLGSVNLRLPVPANKTIVETSFSMHDFLAIVIIVLISIHVLAALYHHFVLRDYVLKRMLPFTDA